MTTNDFDAVPRLCQPSYSAVSLRPSVRPSRILIAAAVVALNMLAGVSNAQDVSRDTRPGVAPDIREDESRLKVQRGNFVVVPIPISNPTLDSGLVAGGAYFYPQSEQQADKQPASLTAAAGMYTNNDSKAFGIAQQNYWRDDKWRFTGALGAADLRLAVLVADGTGGGTSVDWQISGSFFFAKLATRLKGHWYGGVFTRLIDANQSLDIPASSEASGFHIGDVTSIGVGLLFEFDTRDMPLNSFSGRHFKIDALFNDAALGSDHTYQSYSTAYRSYHKLAESLVLAWELQGCKRGATAPLWDACTVKLRGFSATDYLGRVSASGQAEARWQLSNRWGLVAFAGGGFVDSSFSGERDHDSIPSYGVGIRFSVLPAKRINLRVDYARSLDDDAVYVSVGEAF